MGCSPTSALCLYPPFFDLDNDFLRLAGRHRERFIWSEFHIYFPAGMDCDDEISLRRRKSFLQPSPIQTWLRDF